MGVTPGRRPLSKGWIASSTLCGGYSHILNHSSYAFDFFPTVWGVTPYDVGANPFVQPSSPLCGGYSPLTSVFIMGSGFFPTVWELLHEFKKPCWGNHLLPHCVGVTPKVIGKVKTRLSSSPLCGGYSRWFYAKACMDTSSPLCGGYSYGDTVEISTALLRPHCVGVTLKLNFLHVYWITSSPLCGGYSAPEEIKSPRKSFFPASAGVYFFVERKALTNAKQ